MIHNFKAAARMFEAAMLNTQHTKAIRKKLIICYTQTDKFEKALELLISFIDEDIDFIININPMEVECPCTVLIEQIKKNLDMQQDVQINYLKLGIFWLYLELKQSVKYFELARHQSQFEHDIEIILNCLYKRMEANNVNSVN